MKGCINRFIIKTIDSRYLVYNKDNINVGEVVSNFSINRDKFPRAEIKFYPDYEGNYGTWHRLQSDGGLMPFSFFKMKMESHGVFEYSGFIKENSKKIYNTAKTQISSNISKKTDLHKAVDKEREIRAVAEVLKILVIELKENRTPAIDNIFRYAYREVSMIPKPLASKKAWLSFNEKTGRDLRNYRQYDHPLGIKLNQYYTFEHKTTASSFKKDLIRLYEEKTLTLENIIKLIKLQEICWVTKEEDMKLKELGYQSYRLDSDKAYQEAGIEIYE